MTESKTILFLDKVLTKPKKGTRLRGVEVFNIAFLRDLDHLNHKVTLLAHPTWVSTLEQELSSCTQIEIKETSQKLGKVLGSVIPLFEMRDRHFDLLFLANVGDGILIPYHLTQSFRKISRTTLLAHKIPGPIFLSGLKKTTRVVSVNRQISRCFEKAGYPDTEVYYGITDATQFHPKPDSKPADDIVRFGMIGDLDSSWKGSDLAIEAFQALPEELRAKSELHLAGYSNEKPDVTDTNIHLHDWIARDKVGDYLRSLDVMLNLSREIDGKMMETFCQTMVQGMLCGLAQITTDLEILTEKIDQGGGVTIQDKDELVTAMTSYIKNRSTAADQGRIACEIAKKRYVWDSEYFISGECSN